MIEYINKSKFIIIAEYLFTILPMVILISVLLFQYKFTDIIYNRDWSFVSIILIGQTLLKLNYGLQTVKEKIDSSKSYFFNALIICFGLIPSVLVYAGLSFIINPPDYLYYLQLIYVILSTVVFFIFGLAGQAFIESKAK